MAMEIRYRELFQVEIRHGFYDGGICRGLALAPTPACNTLLQRHRCRFRPATGGGAVWFGAVDGRAGIADFAEPGPFTFMLIAIERDFSTITDLDPSGPDPTSTILYFDNLEAGEGEFMGQRFLLLNPAPGTALPVRARAFRHRFDGALGGRGLSIVTVPGGREVWRGPAPPQPFTHLDLDLRGVSDGRCLLQVDGSNVLDFYLTDQPVAAIFGIVDIYPGGPAPAATVPPEARVLDAQGTVAPKTFTVGLDGRRTIWRYVVVSRSPERDYGEATVAGGNPTGEFEPTLPFNAAGPTEAGGRPAWVFESRNPIPLFESPAEQYRFMLSAREDGALPADKVRLPYAASSGTRLVRQDGATRMCSEIYVYL